MLLLGASGFVGKAIAREAAGRGWMVICVSRGGMPSLPTNTVEFRGDALDRETYRRVFKWYPTISSVVHSIGILFEPPQSGEPRQAQTYERINRDTVLMALEESIAHGIDSFAFVSAADIPGARVGPLERYYAAKREAEEAIIAHPEIPTRVIARPGLIYGPERRASQLLTFGYNLMTFWAKEFPPASRVDRVAARIVDAVSGSECVGTCLPGGRDPSVILLEPKHLQ